MEINNLILSLLHQVAVEVEVVEAVDELLCVQPLILSVPMVYEHLEPDLYVSEETSDLHVQFDDDQDRSP